MRIRNLVVVGVLLLPAVAFAQRRGTTGGVIGGRGPAQPVPLSPQPPEIARRLAYTRSRLSVESYPLFSRASVSEFRGLGALSQWSGYGMGTRAEWRTASSIAATMDFTTTIGAPVQSQTLELGARYRPVPWDHAIRPFVDLRAAYAFASGSYAEAPFGIVPAGLPQQSRYGMQQSRGLGAVAGAGMEYWFAQRFALTTGVSALRSDMGMYDNARGTLLGDGGYWMTTYRFTVGLKFNQVRSFIN